MPAKFSQSILAAALADLTLMPPCKAAKKHGVSARTLKRYQTDLDPASPLAAEVQSITNNRDTSWSAALPQALNETIAALEVEVNDRDSNPKRIAALVSAVKTLNGVQLTRKVFQDRFSSYQP